MLGAVMQAGSAVLVKQRQVAIAIRVVSDWGMQWLRSGHCLGRQQPTRMGIEAVQRCRTRSVFKCNPQSCWVLSQQSRMSMCAFFWLSSAP